MVLGVDTSFCEGAEGECEHSDVVCRLRDCSAACWAGGGCGSSARGGETAGNREEKGEGGYGCGTRRAGWRGGREEEGAVAFIEQRLYMK